MSWPWSMPMPWSKRAFDILGSFLFLFLLSPLFLILALLVKTTSRGPVFYWSNRVGKYNQIFRMPKFRSMRVDTPQVATHLLSNPSMFLTPVGDFLRRTSLDELPQLINIFIGSLSFVGPRPALFNQADLIALRTERGIHALVPGLTGWAQINGRDELSIPVKVQYDAEYLKRRSFKFDFYILCMTAVKVARRKDIHH